MKSDLPKVLQPLPAGRCSRTSLRLRSALDADAIHVVTATAASRCEQALADEPVHWVLQAEQLGTGHAVAQAMPAIPDEHQVLVLFGDVPLVRVATLRATRRRGPTRARIGVLTRACSTIPPATAASCATTPATSCASSSTRTRTPRSARIHEVNTGLMAAPARALRALARRAQERQRAGRVLPDRRDRDGGRGRHEGERRDLADRGGGTGRQRQGAARRARSARFAPSAPTS